MNKEKIDDIFKVINEKNIFKNLIKTIQIITETAKRHPLNIINLALSIIAIIISFMAFSTPRYSAEERTDFDFSVLTANTQNNLEICNHGKTSKKQLVLCKTAIKNEKEKHKELIEALQSERNNLPPYSYGKYSSKLLAHDVHIVMAEMSLSISQQEIRETQQKHFTVSSIIFRLFSDLLKNINKN